MGQLFSIVLRCLSGVKVGNGSAETPGGISEPLISAAAGLSSTIEDPAPTTAAALPQKLLITPHFCSIDVEQYHCSYTGNDTSYHQLQEDILGSAETPGGTSEPHISATAGLSSTIEEDPPTTTAAALPQKLLITPHFCSIDVEQDYCSYRGDDTSYHQLQEDTLGSAEAQGGMSESHISATAGLSSTMEEGPPPTTAAALPQKHLITPHFCSIDVEQYYCSYTGNDTSHHQLQEDILGSAETPGGTSEPHISATAGLSSTIEEDPPTTTAAALPQKLLITPHFCSIDVEQDYCSYTGDDTYHQLQEDTLGSAEAQGGISKSHISATAGLSSTMEEDPPPTTAAALPQKHLITPHFCGIDIEQYYCSYTGDDTSHHQLQEDILSLWSLESSLSDEADSISSKTDEVDQDTRLVEVLCQVAKDFESEPELWTNQYSSRQKILLVGEGDFSFSASLAFAFGSATNIVATSLDSEGFLTRNYRRARANIGCLRARGAKVFHGVDATEMAENFIFQGMKFDRVVFNFPLAGFFPDESRKSQLERNKNLIRLYMRNAKKMIVEAKGEIHITHKSNGFFKQWNLQRLASSEGLQLKQEVHFNFTDYPGYRTKYGFGGGRNFNCNPSKSYIFGLININA